MPRLMKPKIGLKAHHGSWLRRALWYQDLFIWREIWEQDDYRVRQLAWKPAVVLDVGAHIGLFSGLARHLWPFSRIISVEPVAENAEVIRRNCPGAEVRVAACTYDPEPLRIRVQLDRDGHSGGSHQSANGERLVPRVTLDELMQGFGHDVLLKLDCEGAEFSILEHAQCFDRIRSIVGESHGHAQFVELVQRKFPAWKLTVYRDSHIGLYRLDRP